MFRGIGFAGEQHHDHDAFFFGTFCRGFQRHSDVHMVHLMQWAIRGHTNLALIIWHHNVSLTQNHGGVGAAVWPFVSIEGSNYFMGPGLRMTVFLSASRLVL